MILLLSLFYILYSLINISLICVIRLLKGYLNPNDNHINPLICHGSECFYRSVHATSLAFMATYTNHTNKTTGIYNEKREETQTSCGQSLTHSSLVRNTFLEEDFFK